MESGGRVPAALWRLLIRGILPAAIHFTVACRPGSGHAGGLPLPIGLSFSGWGPTALLLLLLLFLFILLILWRRLSAARATGRLLEERADELEQMLAGWIAGLDFAEVEAKLGPANVPFGGIYTVAEIMDDPHYAERDNVLKVADDAEGEVTMPGVVPKLMDTPGRVTHAGPALGAHNAEIYGGLLGKSDADLATLKEQGVI